MKYTRAKIISITPIADKPGWDEILVQHLDNTDVVVEQEIYQVERTAHGEEIFKSILLSKCRSYNDIYLDNVELGVGVELYPTKIVTFIATTLLGLATFTLTDDGLPTGRAIFAEILALQITPEKDVTSVAQTVSGSIKTISADNKIAVANIVRASGNFALDGTKVYLTVTGK